MIRKILQPMVFAYAVSLMTFNSVSASIIGESEITISGGWREDHLRSSITANDSPGFDVIKGSDLNIWQVGIDGRITPYFSPCLLWLNNFLLRGTAYWGWVSNGVYHHENSISPADGIADDRGDITQGNTWDYDIGFGYLFPVYGDQVKIGPMGGYSWNKLSFSPHDVIGVLNTPITQTSTGQTVVSTLDPLTYFDEGSSFNSRWEGPWVGADIEVDFCKFTLCGSYEYHWTRWRGSYNSKFPDLLDDLHFSDRRNGSSGYGHVGVLEGYYDLDGGFTVGLGVKYTYFCIRGKEVPQASGGFVDVGGTSDEVNYVHTTWSSTALLLDIGYSF